MKKLIAPIVLVLLIVYMIVAFVTMTPVYNRENVYVVQEEFSETIDCEKYQDKTFQTTQRLEIQQEGKYMIEAQWNNDSDLIVGYMLVSSAGEIKAYCTGNEVEMETTPILLEVGTYEMVFYYMIKEADLEAFGDKVGETPAIEISEVTGSCTVMGDYGIRQVGPRPVVEGVYVVTMIIAIMGSVLALFIWILKFKQ